MASATTRPPFIFNLSTTKSQASSKLPRPHFTFPIILSKNHSISSLNTHSKLQLTHKKSIDVSKEDKPISEQEQSTAETLVENASVDENQEEEEVKFDKRRLEEKFAVLNTGIFECRSCGYKYDESVGDSSYPIPPGLPFDKLPDDWRCPTCGASKSFFESKSVEIAGFAQNQQFGLGGNALTSAQKAVLIYGGLFLGFVFFLSGYFLQ